MAAPEPWWRTGLRVAFWTWLAGAAFLALVWVAIPLLELARRDTAADAARARVAPGRHHETPAVPLQRKLVVLHDGTQPIPTRAVGS